MFLTILYLILIALYLEIRIEIIVYRGSITTWVYQNKMHRAILFCPPFKGTFAYETQIFALVLQVCHSGNEFKKRKIGKLYYWFDSCWLR